MFKITKQYLDVPVMKSRKSFSLKDLHNFITGTSIKNVNFCFTMESYIFVNILEKNVSFL